MSILRPGSKTFAIGLAVLLFLIAAVPSYIILSRKTKFPVLEQVKGAASEKPKFVTLEILSQGVSVKTQNGKEFTEAKEGQELQEGSTVKTDTDGSAQIVFTNGTTTRIDGGSEVALTDYKAAPFNITLSLTAGRIWSRVAKLLGNETYQTETSSVVATVRGTSYGHEVVEGEDKLIVTKGGILSACENGNQSALIDQDQWGVFDCTKSAPKMGAITEDVKADEWFKRNVEEDKKVETRFAPDTFSDLEKVKGIKNKQDKLPKLQFNEELKLFYFSPEVKSVDTFSKFLKKDEPIPTPEPDKKLLPDILDNSTLNNTLNIIKTPTPEPKSNKIQDKLNQEVLNSSTISPNTVITKTPTPLPITKLATPTPTPLKRQ